MKNSMNYLQKLLTVCTIVFSLAACNKSDDQVSGGNMTLVSPADNKIVCLADDSEAKEISFSAEGDWIATPDKGWMKLSQIQGNAGSDQTILLTIAHNDTFEQRVGTITIKDKQSGKSVAITVTQGAKGAVFAFSDPTMKLTINSERKEITGSVKVTSNYDWSISIPGADTWLTYTIVREKDGTKTVTFYAEPDKMDAYDARSAEVSFSYIPDTRAPGVEKYSVSFDGITPEVKFVDNSTNEEISTATLQDLFDEGLYKATFKVVANVAWKMDQIPGFVNVQLVEGNHSSKFFATETSVVLELKEGKLDTETLQGDLLLKDIFVNVDKPLASVGVQLLGVGNDYVFADRSAFPGDITGGGNFMFEHQGVTEWESATKQFLVKAANHANVRCYMVRLDSQWGYPYKTRYDEYGEEVSNNVGGRSNSWGGVDPVDPSFYKSTRTPVQGQMYEVWLKARSEYESGSTSDQNRYFALFVVSKNKANTYDDLFDAEGSLKPEFEYSYIKLGQKSKPVNYSFYSPQVSEGQTLKAKASGETITIEYESDAQYLNLYENVSWSTPDDPFDWKGDNLSGDMIEADLSQMGKIKFKVKPNTTGVKRSTKLGIAAYVEGKENEYLLITFTIEQAAE